MTPKLHAITQSTLLGLSGGTSRTNIAGRFSGKVLNIRNHQADRLLPYMLTSYNARGRLSLSTVLL
jgi:hypothetical protein